MLDEIFMHAIIMLFINHPSAMLNNKAIEYVAYSIINVTQIEKILNMHSFPPFHLSIPVKSYDQNRIWI